MGTIADRAGATQWVNSVVRRVVPGGPRLGQEGSGRVCNRARAPLNWDSQGQPWGRCRVRRRALRVRPPAREKKRLRRVLVVTSCSPRAMRAVQRSRLWAITCTASQAPFGKLRIGGKASRGEMVEPHAVLQVPDGILDLGVAAVVGLQFQGVAVPVGDGGVIAVAGEQRQLGAGRGLDPADDEPHRYGIGLATEGRVFSLGHVGGALHPVGYGPPVCLGYGLYQVAQAPVMADGDGEVDTHPAAEGDD